MTKQFEKLLFLFGDAALARHTNAVDENDREQIIDMAAKQGIWSVVYPVMGEIYDMTAYRLEFLKYVSKSISRNEFTAGIIKKAQDRGIDICVVKGIVAASLYANPQYRISSDTDIYVKNSDEKKLLKFLKENGYSIESKQKNGHHAKARHPVGGLLEVHTSLCNEIEDRLIFGDKIKYTEPWIKTNACGYEFYTLGINDNLKFLTAHYIKHFVSGGSSVRQMMDLLLYMKRYESEIDFEEYDRTLAELKYDKLISTVKSIGAKYFGMDFSVCSDEDMTLLLNDCEIGGLFGKASKNKTGMYPVYCKRRHKLSNFKLKFIFWFKSEYSVFVRMFPPQPVLLKRGYKYAQNRLLVPFAWIHRFFDIIFKKDKVSDKDNSDDVLRRTETMRNLGLFE